jgi:hypothetical protein
VIVHCQQFDNMSRTKGTLYFYLDSNLSFIPVSDFSVIMESRESGVLPGRILNLLISADIVPLIACIPYLIPVTHIQYTVQKHFESVKDMVYCNSRGSAVTMVIYG